MYDDTKMLANYKYRDFKTKTNDEFEEASFDCCEYEFSSNAFSDIDIYE